MDVLLAGLTVAAVAFTALAIRLVVGRRACRRHWDGIERWISRAIRGDDDPPDDVLSS